MTDKIKKLSEFLEKSPGDPFLQHAMALEYIKLGDDAMASGIFTALLEKTPGYVGSYYHFGKLLERTGEKEKASGMYEKGMKEARSVKDQHAYNELQAAYEDLEY